MVTLATASADRRWTVVGGRLVPILQRSQDDDGGDEDSGRIKKLTDEARKHRLRAKKYRQMYEESQAWIEKLKQDGAIDASTGAGTTGADELARERVLRAFDRAAIKAGITDLDAAAKLMSDELAELELDDDGKPDAEAIEAVLEQLEERHPTLLSAAGAQTPPPPAKASTNRRQQSGSQLDIDYLATKYPALGGRMFPRRS